MPPLSVMAWLHPVEVGEEHFVGAFIVLPACLCPGLSASLEESFLELRTQAFMDFR